MKAPSIEQWLTEAKGDGSAPQCGMYLCHNGVVRQTPRARVRGGEKNLPPVKGMYFDYDQDKAERAGQRALAMDGIHYVRLWLNRGALEVGDDIMLVLVGGDIRPRVTAALDYLVSELKTNCVTEKEIY